MWQVRTRFRMCPVVSRECLDAVIKRRGSREGRNCHRSQAPSAQSFGLVFVWRKIWRHVDPKRVKTWSFLTGDYSLFVLGNLLGPVVNTTIEGGLERFITQPTGCGEQTMIRLAPNVYVLKYLMNTNQLTGANEANAFRFIQSGKLC